MPDRRDDEAVIARIDPVGPEFQKACIEAGCHDLTEPLIIRDGAHLLHASTEGVVSICRRCGAALYGGRVEKEWG